MATRFMYIALATAALGIAPSFLLAAPTTASPAWSYTAAAPPLDSPAAPSNCKSKYFPADMWDEFPYDLTFVSWKDNSTNEDGFIFEIWRKQSGVWALAGSFGVPADYQGVMLGGSFGPSYKFRVKAFNASGDSSWSHWGH